MSSALIIPAVRSDLAQKVLLNKTDGPIWRMFVGVGVGSDYSSPLLAVALTITIQFYGYTYIYCKL